MTEGRRQLLTVIHRTTVRHVARRCSVTANAVYNWLSGRNTPGPRARRALLHSYGIPPESWGHLHT